MKIVYISLLTLLVASCAHHPPLTKGTNGKLGGADVVLMKPNMEYCKFLKDIEELFFFARKNALNVENHLKNSVAEAGGNVGQPTKVSVFQPYIKGKAYKCKADYVTNYKKQLHK